MARRVNAFFLSLTITLGATASSAPAAGGQGPAAMTDRTPRATASVASYRYGDLIWENDRTAHRIYGEPLEATEPPSSSGIDAWAKRVRWPFMERAIKGGKYHDTADEGVDFYGVHGTRGAGGLGIWYDNKLWTSRNYRNPRILQNGPDVARFRVDYAPWPVGVSRSVSETRSFELPLGTNFTRMTSTLSSNRPGPLVVGIGISKHPTSDANGTLVVDRAKGSMTFWSPEDPKNGAMGVAILVDPAAIVEFKEDYDNYLVLIRVRPGKPFVYYMGAAWSKGLDFHTVKQWSDYVAGQRPDFRP